jgi:DNA modification methylase
LTMVPVAERLASEADMYRTLATGTYTLGGLYDLCEQTVAVERDGGWDTVPGHPTDLVWKHRARGKLANLHKAGLAERLSRSVWFIQGTYDKPERLVLLVTGATLTEFELRLASAVELLTQLDGPADLVLADPPWALGRGENRHFANGSGYRRDHTKIIGGYRDVDPAEYEDFTHGWIQAASGALRPGGQLAVITGPQRAAVNQYAAEHAGLTWVSSIVAKHPFPLYTQRRPACAHWTVTVMCNGPLTSKRRVFNPPPDQLSRDGGNLYPLDWWDRGVGRADRQGLLRYDNSLPLPLVLRLIKAFSNRGDRVAEPFAGGGTGAVACWLTQRRYAGGDINQGAINFTAARLLAEHVWPAEARPTLFPAYD